MAILSCHVSIKLPPPKSVTVRSFFSPLAKRGHREVLRVPLGCARLGIQAIENRSSSVISHRRRSSDDGPIAREPFRRVRLLMLLSPPATVGVSCILGCRWIRQSGLLAACDNGIEVVTGLGTHGSRIGRGTDDHGARGRSAGRPFAWSPARPGDELPPARAHPASTRRPPAPAIRRAGNT